VYPNDRGYPALAERFSRAGFVTVIFNFRGAGGSEGNFDILGWTRDLQAVLAHMCGISNVDKDRISIMGFSAGGAVSIYVASQNTNVSSVISCASPTVSLFGNNRNMAKRFLSEFRDVGIIKDDDFPPSLDDWMASFNHVYSLKWIKNISPRPLLIVHGTDDDVVPVKSAWDLYGYANEPKDIMIIDGAGHRLRICQEAMDGALNWLNNHLYGD
jgi:alpha/beta superfamily hydrolase